MSVLDLFVVIKNMETGNLVIFLQKRVCESISVNEIA